MPVEAAQRRKLGVYVEWVVVAVQAVERRQVLARALLHHCIRLAPVHSTRQDKQTN